MARFTDMFTELVRVEIELWDDLDAHLETAVGITLSQFQALATIRGNGGTTRVQDISAEMSITVGATSKLVDRLERDGLAARSANPNDRRSSHVTLTERGLRALVAADEAAEAHLRGTLTGAVSDEDVDRLRGDLAALRSVPGAAPRAAVAL